MMTGRRTRRENGLPDPAPAQRGTPVSAATANADTKWPPDDEELAAQLGELVRRLTRRLRRSSSERLELFGLTDGQARVLSLVARSGAPLRMSQVAQRIEVVPRSATTVVAGLEEKGLVLREIDRNDRRSILVRLTKAGADVFDELGRDRDIAAVELFGRIQRSDRLELLQLLARIVTEGDGEAQGSAQRLQGAARAGESSAGATHETPARAPRIAPARRPDPALQ